ncbi:MAG: nitrogen regulation protein NR(II) [Opitutales bacterium]
MPAPTWIPLPVFLSSDGLIEQLPEHREAPTWFQPGAALAGASLLEALDASGWHPATPQDAGPLEPGTRLELVHQADASRKTRLDVFESPSGLLANLTLTDLEPDADQAQSRNGHDPHSDSLQHFLAACPSVYYRQDADFNYLWIGPGAEDLFGTPPDQLTAQPGSFWEQVLERDHPIFKRLGGDPNTARQNHRLDFRIRHGRHGQVRYLRDERHLRTDPHTGQAVWEGVFWDISRQTIAEKHLRRTAWKEHLATLTSGLVHDFSNVMAGIYGLADLYAQDLDENHPWYKGMGQIRKSSTEARKLVRRIIDLNREQETAPNYHNIETLIQEQLELAPAILPKGTHIETSFSGEEIPVYLDAVTFRQVFLNFLINTRDALGTKGRVEIEVRKRAAEQPILEECYGCGGLRAGSDGVEIRVRDNGCGIPETHLARIFDPYFTTKDTTQGSGFGLYNARLFAEENRGHLGVCSRPGEGCAMVLFLPIADFSEAFSENAPEETAQAAMETGTRRRVLVFAAEKSRECNLIDLMIARQWEVLTLTRPQALRDQLSDDTQPPPDLVALIDIDQDVHASALTDMARVRYPEVPVVLRVFGRNPDELTTNLRERLTAVFDESLRDADVVKKVSTLFHDCR